jgi:hypothetical protein
LSQTGMGAAYPFRSLAASSWIKQHAGYGRGAWSDTCLFGLPEGASLNCSNAAKIHTKG